MSTAYEKQRAANIARNAELLSSLGIQQAPIVPLAAPSKARGGSKKRKKAPAAPREPTRKSARLTTADGAYTEPSGIDPEPDEPRGSLLRQMPAVEIPDADDVEYDPSFVAPAPTRDDDGTLRFETGYEHFTPNLIPREIFEQGACASTLDEFADRSVGGTAFRPYFSRVGKRQLDPDYDEFDSLADLEASLLTSEEYEPSRNKYGVKAGQSLEDWEKSGWIRAPDYRGWIQWRVRGS